jgi:hypothetical protein
MMAQVGRMNVALFFLLPSAVDGDGWLTPRPGRFTPGNDTVPIVLGDVCAPGPFWTFAKTSPPLGFDPHTFQQVVSRCTDRAVQTRLPFYVFIFFHCNLGPTEVQRSCWQDEQRFSLSTSTIKGQVLIKLLSAETIRY